MSELKFEGCWAVVTMETGHMYIGRIFETRAVNGRVEKISATDVAKLAMAERRMFHMEPAFEYSTPLQPTPQGVVRKTVVLPPGVTRGVPVYGHPTSAYFFDDMNKEDCKEHQEMLKHAWEQIKKSTMGDAQTNPILDLTTGSDPRVLEQLRRQGVNPR